LVNPQLSHENLPLGVIGTVESCGEHVWLFHCFLLKYAVQHMAQR